MPLFHHVSCGSWTGSLQESEIDLGAISRSSLHFHTFCISRGRHINHNGNKHFNRKGVHNLRIFTLKTSNLKLRKFDSKSLFFLSSRKWPAITFCLLEIRKMKLCSTTYLNYRIERRLCHTWQTVLCIFCVKPSKDEKSSLSKNQRKWTGVWLSIEMSQNNSSFIPSLKKMLSTVC